MQNIRNYKYTELPTVLLCGGIFKPKIKIEMAKHLRFDLLWAPYNNVKQEHPQKVMKELGITYQHATPQSMGDQWWLWNCENTPEQLPPYLKVADWNPMEMIGYGLSQEDAEKIRDYKSVG